MDQHAPLPAGSVIGILGSGQLGRLLAIAAARLGFDCHIYSPETDSPAGRVAAHETVGSYDDAEALLAFASSCDVVTCEFENVPARVLAEIEAAGTDVFPRQNAFEIAQDRVTEKTFLNANNIPTADFVPLETLADLRAIAEKHGGHGIIKTCRDGYDGKGQARIAPGDDLTAIWQEFSGVPVIFEALARFEQEISVLVARTQSGAMQVWTPSQNIHESGILRKCLVPAKLSDATLETATQKACALAEALEYVGVLALEFFVMEDGSVLANEFAPRVHNSGHWTPELCETDQFEQHIRAITGWTLCNPRLLFSGEMGNLLGEETLDDTLKNDPTLKLTLYGKRAPKPGRKMGHWVRIGDGV